MSDESQLGPNGDGLDNDEDRESYPELPVSPNDQTVPDTDPPPAIGSWLEQYAAISQRSLEQVRETASHGLTAEERIVLMKFAMQLMALGLSGAKEEDFTDEQKTDVEALIAELEASYNIGK